MKCMELFSELQIVKTLCKQRALLVVVLLATLTAVGMFHETRKREVPTSVLKPLSSNESRGYVLAEDYYEGQTQASRNLQNLQCWAAKYNLLVVEPALAGTHLGTPLHDHPGFWFRDMFDLEMWNRLSFEKQHSELVARETFLSSAPRDVILVSCKHAYPDEIKETLRKISTSNSPHTPQSQRVQEGCSVNWKSAKEFLHSNHFHVVRQVCFNFAYGDKLSTKQFKSHLYGSLSPASSTVVFKQWRGMGRVSSRVRIHDARCPITGMEEEVRPSQQLLLTAASYQETFLGGAPYIAVMARIEKVQIYLKKRKQGLPSLAQCFSKLLAAWRETKQQSRLNTTLLAIDMGKFGRKGTGEFNTIFKDFFSSLYGTELTVHGWEDSFENVAHTNVSGYVALLQEVLVAQAKCVVFIGGGSFQRHTYFLYKQVHRTEPCVKIIRECTPVHGLPRIT